MNNKASLYSQLGNDTCLTSDTEDMFCLRQTDDYQSKIKLGNSLMAQYRFKEALEVFNCARQIKDNDISLYIRLAGAYLTLMDFDNSIKAYNKALALGANEKQLSFYFAIWHFFKCDYLKATHYLENSLPCDDEMLVAIIYWHTICAYRSNSSASLLHLNKENIKVEHHRAYMQANMIFSGDITHDFGINLYNSGVDSLNYSIIMFAVYNYMQHSGEFDKANKALKLVLENDSTWPCIPYLAAMIDFKAKGL